MLLLNYLKSCRLLTARSKGALTLNKVSGNLVFYFFLNLWQKFAYTHGLLNLVGDTFWLNFMQLLDMQTVTKCCSSLTTQKVMNSYTQVYMLYILSNGLSLLTHWPLPRHRLSLVCPSCSRTAVWCSGGRPHCSSPHTGPALPSPPSREIVQEMTGRNTTHSLRCTYKDAQHSFGFISFPDHYPKMSCFSGFKYHSVGCNNSLLTYITSEVLWLWHNKVSDLLD